MRCSSTGGPVGLDDVDVVAADGVTHRDMAFTVGKALDDRLGNVRLEHRGNGSPEFRNRASNHQRETHRVLPCSGS